MASFNNLLGQNALTGTGAAVAFAKLNTFPAPDIDHASFFMFDPGGSG